MDTRSGGGAPLEPILTNEWSRNEGAWIVTAHGDKWKVTWLPAGLRDSCICHSDLGEMALIDVVERAGKSYTNRDKLVEDLRGQLNVMYRLHEDAVYRQRVQRAEQRMYRIWAIILPGLRQFMAIMLGSGRRKGSE